MPYGRPVGEGEQSGAGREQSREDQRHLGHAADHQRELGAE
ncbi:hypothetical protein RJT17_32035 [Streptomyces sp. P5-A9]